MGEQVAVAWPRLCCPGKQPQVFLETLEARTRMIWSRTCPPPSVGHGSISTGKLNRKPDRNPQAEWRFCFSISPTTRVLSQNLLISGKGSFLITLATATWAPQESILGNGSCSHNPAWVSSSSLLLRSFACTLWRAPEAHCPPVSFPLGSCDPVCLAIKHRLSQSRVLGPPIYYTTNTRAMSGSGRPQAGLIIPPGGLLAMSGDTGTGCPTGI